jgi:hypothetical protein
MSKYKQAPSPAGPPTRRRPGGATHASKENTPGPRLPSERDESADSQASPDPSHRDVMDKAYEDAKRGRPDTDKGPVLDEVYNDELTRRDSPPRH